jgi:hypothetical protein
MGDPLTCPGTRLRKTAIFFSLFVSAVLVPNLHFPDAAATEVHSSIVQVPATHNANGNPPSCAPDSPTSSEVAEALAQTASGEGPQGGSPAGPLVSTEGAIATVWTRAATAQQFLGMIHRGGGGCVVLCVVIPGNVGWTTTTLVAKDSGIAGDLSLA